MPQSNDHALETKIHGDGTVDYVLDEAVHGSKEHESRDLATIDAGYSHVIADLPPAEGRRALRKIDYRLVPLLAVLYLVAFIDRSNMQV